MQSAVISIEWQQIFSILVSLVNSQTCIFDCWNWFKWESCMRFEIWFIFNRIATQNRNIITTIYLYGLFQILNEIQQNLFVNFCWCFPFSYLLTLMNKFRMHYDNKRRISSNEIIKTIFCIEMLCKREKEMWIFATEHSIWRNVGKVFC